MAGFAVAEVGRQPCQPALDIDAGPVPIEQCANGKRMPEVMDSGRDRGVGANPRAVAEPAEDGPDAFVDDARAVQRDEETRGLGVRAKLTAALLVAL